MSGATWENVSLTTKDGKYVIWLDTYYFDLKPHSIASMTPGLIWGSNKVTARFVNILFRFQFERVSELDFHVTCFQSHRTSSGCHTPSGYSLEFQCSINHFSNGNAKVFEMQPQKLEVMETFSLDASYQQLFSPADLDKPFELKILIKMIEYECVENQSTSSLNNDILIFIDRKFYTPSLLQDLAYIMRIPRFENIFTGRQNTAFSEAKTNYIRRAFHYAKEIADYMRAKDAKIPPRATDMGPFLNFVLNGKREQITNEALIGGYLVGHLMGLAFVVELCRERIILKLSENVKWINRSFFINSLRVADHVNDYKLSEAVARTFERWERELGNSEALIDLLKSKGIKGQFMLYTLTRQRKMIEEERRLAAEVEESSQSSPEYVIIDSDSEEIKNPK